MNHIAIKHVMFMTSLSRGQVYIMERANHLPNRKLRSNTRGVWLQDDICAWMQTCLDTQRLHQLRPNTIVNLADRFITKKEVIKLVNMSAPTILQQEIAGTFPSRVKITKTRVGWLYREIIDWLAARPSVH